jgi:hypothetical protein
VGWGGRGGRKRKRGRKVYRGCGDEVATFVRHVGLCFYFSRGGGTPNVKRRERGEEEKGRNMWVIKS